MKKIPSLIITLSLLIPALSCCATPFKEKIPNLKSGINTEYIDTSIRPQDNFYQYVNGLWLENSTIPDDKTSIGSFYDLADQSKHDVNKLIKALSSQNDLAKNTDQQKIVDLYRSYMNTNRINKIGIKPLQPELLRISTIQNKAQLATYFARATQIGVTTPFNQSIYIDLKNSKRYAFYLNQGNLSLPESDYYFNTSPRFVALRAGLLKHMEMTLSMAGMDNTKEKANRIFALEKKLAGYHWTPVQLRNVDNAYNPINISNIPELAQSFDWANYFTALGLKKNKAVIVGQPSYIQGFDKVFADTSIDDWKTYMAWQLIRAYTPLLSQNFVTEQFAFYGTELHGQKKQKPRWELAVNLVNDNLGELVGKLYVKEHFTAAHKKKMLQLVEHLREAYQQSIDELDWMTPETKAMAKLKLQSFVAKIGYPDQWHDYSEVIIEPNALIPNIMTIKMADFQRDIAKLGGQIQTWEWGMNPQRVNAYYSPTMNEIVFPAAILQPPFFDMSADDAVNYGAIGAVIGHEMGHGFDDQGAKFDNTGSLNNWWTEEDLTRFQKKCAALIAQYNSYYVFPDLHINGQLTLGENIGDLSGASIAYKAYQLALKGKNAPVIDGFTGDQRFFIGFAQIWRAKHRDATARNRVATDPHSPSEYRAIGPLSNMPAFYKAFGVSPGDAMYIDDAARVKIW